jgi:hypothetical protein
VFLLSRLTLQRTSDLRMTLYGAYTPFCFPAQDDVTMCRHPQNARKKPMPICLSRPPHIRHGWTMRQSPTYRFSSISRWVAVVIHGLWLVGLIVAWVWWNLFLTAHELHVEGGIVRWIAPLRSGELPLPSIRSIRNVVPFWPWPLVRIGGSGGPSVFIYGTSELRPFVDALLERGGIDVDERSYRSWHHDRWRLWM